MEKQNCQQSRSDIPDGNINISSNKIKKEDKKALTEEKISKINTMPEYNAQNLNNYQIESFVFSMVSKESIASQTEVNYDEEYSPEEEAFFKNILLILQKNQ